MRRKVEKMILREYQEEAVATICHAMDTSHKLRVEISIGLGRSAIIAALSHRCINNRSKVLVLTPNRTTCYQLRDTFVEMGRETDIRVPLYTKEYAEHKILITTYRDLKNSGSFNADGFDIIICDGIHYLDQAFVEHRFRNKNTYFIGFTSQVGVKVSGWFYDAECTFRYTIQDAIQEGYLIKGYLNT